MRRKSRPSSLKWPGPDEQVTRFHASMAIAFGNAPVLARYLLESARVAPNITRLIAFMLDPSARSFEPDDDGDHEWDWCETWRLEFKRIGPGNRRNFPESDVPLIGIGLFIEEQIQAGVKVEAACHEAMKTFKISRAAAYNALDKARAAFFSTPSVY